MDFATSSLPLISAHIVRNERFRTNHRFGQLSAPQLQGILAQLDRGDPWQWADLCEFVLVSDDHVASLYSTRITRVVQAKYRIVPNQFGDPKLAQLGAEFINEQLGRIEDFRGLIRNMMDAVSCGYSANEIEWRRDNVAKTNYVQQVTHVHPHRFRYDEQWKLRLYDQGTRHATIYGDVLNPRSWIVHRHQEIAGYPNVDGLMRSCIWRWLFRRWADTFWIQYLEKYGAPFAYAEVEPNTPPQVRADVRQALEDLSNDHAAVIEKGGSIVIEAAHTAAGSESQHEKYMNYTERSLTKAWLGSSDLTDPGAKGSNAAVAVRAGATMDPRMVDDGFRIGDTLQRTMFKWLLWMNEHKFSGAVPIPTMEFQTAHDEVKIDQGQVKTDVGGEQLNAPGSSDGSTQSDAAAPGTVEPKPRGPKSTDVKAMNADPKARSRQPGRRKSKTAEPMTTTSPTTPRSLSPLESALLGKSAGRAR